MNRGHLWKHVIEVLGRSLVVGASSGVLGGALIFFLFGFIGFAGAPLSTRVENGWRAAVDPGFRKGLAAGLAIALALAATVVVWSVMDGRHHPSRTRKWLSALAMVSVAVSNLESLRNAFGWDEVGIATVLGIGLLVAGIVWVSAPWVLKMEIVELSREEAPSPGGLSQR